MAWQGQLKWNLAQGFAVIKGWNKKSRGAKPGFF